MRHEKQARSVSEQLETIQIVDEEKIRWVLSKKVSEKRVDGFCLRSRQEHKAWGVSPRVLVHLNRQARVSGRKHFVVSAVARCQRALIFYSLYPGAYAPGFMLLPASQAVKLPGSVPLSYNRILFPSY